MSQLRRLIDKPTEKALWAFKDDLEVINKDPMRLHKSAFVEWLKVKAELLYMEENSNIEAVDAYLVRVTAEWKTEATRRYHARTNA